MHTKNLFVADDGSTLGTADQGYRCIGVAYGWNEQPKYDEKGELINRLTSTDEAKANAKLWAAAADLAEALQGVLRVADRQTDEFDAARAALAKAGIA
ncbi:MAG TPA: hypothetical protein VN081_07070 [Dongiaceae bacterium]|nr:hypothetical protein [Dongiaceae bacterium]